MSREYTGEYSRVADALFELVETRLQNLFDSAPDEVQQVLLLSQKLTDAEVRILLLWIAAMPDEPNEVST